MEYQKDSEKRWPGAASIARNSLLTLLLLLAASGLCLVLQRIDHVEHGDAYVSMLFILAVFLIARVTSGYLYGIAASLIAMLAVNYFFTYPYYAFNFSLPGYPITMTCMLTVSLLTSALTTRMKEAEKLRRMAEREKLRSNLLRAISHDLRTPLTSILGANSVLMEEEDRLAPEERTKLRREISEEAQWMIRMVENLLTITRIRQDQDNRILKTREYAEEVIAEAVEKFHQHLPAFPVDVTVPETPVICPMDAMLIEQVLMNLMENAAVHAKGATRLEITVGLEDGYALFAAGDDGCGVPRERIKNLFNEDFSTSGSGDQKRNMGIGLSVCKAIVCAHGGTMDAENQKNGGLCVSFRLPLEEGNNEQP